MTPAHCFAQFCPYFHVKWISFFRKTPITENTLNDAGLSKASEWLKRYQKAYTEFQSRYFKTLEFVSLNKGRVLFWGQECYPEKLKRLSWPAATLFALGNTENLNGQCVSVVGSRNPTQLGRLWVQRNVPKLTATKIVIVSGGARGIDTEAHQSTLNSGGSTVAYLPGGLDQLYPVSNRRMFQDILDKGGSLLSEYVVSSEVRAENFQRRNRLIAGQSDLVVIVEAGCKSGTLMTANKAIAENIDISVVPGPPIVENYMGSLELISQGAGLARNHEDILSNLKGRNVL